MSLSDVWQKLFDTFVWYNFPSTSSPVNAANLNKMNTAIDGIDDRVLDLKGGVDDITTALDDKVDKVAGKGLSTNDYDNTAKDIVDGVTSALEGKVDKVEGKGLSENDFTDTLKDKLDGISEQANKVEITPVVTEGTTLATISIDGVNTDIKGSDIDVDDELKPDSTNPVENKVIYSALNDLLPEETAEGNPISITDASGLSAKSCEVTLSPIQSGSGDPSPSNIRPISGRDSVSLSRTGKNLFNATIEQGGIYSSGGKANRTDRCRTETAMRIKSNTEYTVSVGGDAILTGIYFYISETINALTFSSRMTGSGETLTFTAPSEGGYVAFTFAKSDTSSDITPSEVIKPMLELGSTATAYEPYNGESHTATFSDTVYGGVWKPQEGKVVITHKFVSINGNAEWSNYDETSGKYFVDVLSQNEMKIVETDTEYISNMYLFKGTGGSTSGNITTDKRFYGQSRYGRFWVYDSDYANNFEGFKTMLNSTPLQTIYPLATPQEITLTPEIIALLKGNNTLWTDGDNITLKYSADIKEWVLAQLQS